MKVVSLCFLDMKLYTMQTYFPAEYCKQNTLFKNCICFQNILFCSKYQMMVKSVNLIW